MENSPVVDDVRFSDDVCVAMFHWLISCSLSVDLNIKSPHPNFSEINTTTPSSKMLSSTSTFPTSTRSYSITYCTYVLSHSHTICTITTGPRNPDPFLMAQRNGF